MHPYLTRLGVSPMVQEFFNASYTADETGCLCFWYGDLSEHFGFGFHRVPAAKDLWLAGNLNFSQVRLVLIADSALDAVSWLNKKSAFFSDTDNLLFLSTGTRVQHEHIRWINEHLKSKEFCLINGRDVLGGIADLKLAAGIRGLPLEIYREEKGKLLVSFRMETFSFRQDTFSLNAFEKVAKFRFGIRTDKPKNHLTYFDELKAEALFTF